MEDVIDIRACPASKKSFIEIYDMEDPDGNMIEYWGVWRSGSVILKEVPVSEFVLFRMGESDGLPTHDLETAYCDFETEFEGSNDMCDWGYNLYENCKINIEELDNTFHESEELQNEYYTFFDYLENEKGFTIVQYNVRLDGEVEYEEV